MIGGFIGLNARDMIVQFSEKFKYLFINRWGEDTEFSLIFHLAPDRSVLCVPVPEGNWSKLFDSGEVMWGGNGSQIGPNISSDGEVPLELTPYCFVLFERV